MKTTKQFLTLALAAAFLTAGFSAGATSLSFTSDENVIGHQWHFTDIGTADADSGDQGTWNASPVSGGDRYWAHHDTSDDYRREHNVPTGEGANDNDEWYHTPLSGEMVYSPDTDVFNLDPWADSSQSLGSLTPFRPAGSPNLDFAALVEFDVVYDSPPWEDFVASRGNLPGSVESEWNLNAHNRPTEDVDSNFNDHADDGFDDGEDRRMVQRWKFPTTMTFDSINADWDWDAEGDQDISGAWMEVEEYEDTYAQIRFGTANDGRANRGYMFLASNITNITDSTHSSAPAFESWENWNRFETNGNEYRSAGVTGVNAEIDTTVVPEPASMTLLGIGLAGFVTRRFMSRKKKA